MKLHIYRVEHGNIYTESGARVAILTNGRLHEAGWYVLSPNRNDTDPTTIIFARANGFADDFDALGPYETAEQARTLHDGNETAEHTPGPLYDICEQLEQELHAFHELHLNQCVCSIGEPQNCNVFAILIKARAVLADADTRVSARRETSARVAALTALKNLVAADNCNYSRATMRKEGLFDMARAAITKAKKGT